MSSVTVLFVLCDTYCMETIGIDKLLDDYEDDAVVEVVVGLSENGSSEVISKYCGNDGTVLRETEFDICRVRVTIDCLRELKVGGDAWIDFIEPAAQETEKPWDTQYDESYEEQ